jgi:hypothetical protein
VSVRSDVSAPTALLFNSDPLNTTPLPTIAMLVTTNWLLEMPICFVNRSANALALELAIAAS